MLERLLGRRSPQDLAWRPPGGGWSLVEIVGHLLDEERGDFRPRLRALLEDPGRPWEPIDPEGWVRERRHQERALADLLAELRAEREASRIWLAGLVEVDWGRTHAHPVLGAVSAGGLLASWAAHDVLHLRQIAGRLVELVQRSAAPHDTTYAAPG